MTNTTIFAIIALTSTLLLGTSIVQAADHGDAPLVANDQGTETTGAGVVKIMPIGDSLSKGANAIPEWVQFTMQAYLDRDISERELLNAFDFLKKQGIMHESQEAAQEMASLREENQMLKQKIGIDPPPVPEVKLIPVPGALPELPGFPDECPDVYDPVCGRDGRTYPNECTANDAGVGIVHDGECREIPQRECPRGYDWIACAGICAPHGDDNVCPENEKWSEHSGQCTPDSDGCMCTREYDPVCGVDGKTYGNKCEAGCADSEIRHDGECRADLECKSNTDCRGDDVCRDGVCQVPCSIQCVRADPVCGVDGVTYGCGAPDAQCHGVEVAYVGECLAIRAAP